MSFENPWMLWGMLGASIPVIIHMTNRTRAKRKPFAALDFLLLSDKRLARKLKTKQLLVLALRMLLLAAIPFALSKPYVSHPHTGTLNTAAPGSVVIVLDNTLSMRTMRDGRSLFDRAMDEAKELVDNGGPQTNFAIVTIARPVSVLTGDLTYDRSEIHLALEKVRSLESVGNLSAALKEAERILSLSELSLRQVVVISDHTADVWSQVKTPWALKDIPNAVAQAVDKGDAVQNLIVSGVDVVAAPQEGPGVLSAEVRVANLGDESFSPSVRLQLGGESLSKTIKISAGQEARVSFTHKVEGLGLVRGTAILELDDDLVDDNRYYFTIDLGTTLNVLLVNGAPRDERYLDEFFFLKPALSPIDESIRTQVITSDALAHTPLDGFDVVYLANVGGLTPQQRLSIQSFVEAGGGLFVAVGDQFTERSAKTYEGLLPAPIRSFKEVVRRESPSAEARALRIATADVDHPLMADFARTSLFRSLVYQYALVGGVRSEDSSILARLSNGTPAVLEAKLGLGKVLMLTTTLDRDWSDLAMRSSFLPLMQTSTVYLAGRLGNLDQPRAKVGQVVSLKEPLGEGPLVVERPDGVQVAVSSDGRGGVRFDKTSLAGHYLLRRVNDTDRSRPFSVNVDRSESDLARAELSDLKELLSRPGKADAPRGKIESRPGSKAPDPFRSDLWPIVLVALFGLLFAEAWVVIRRIT